MMTTILRFGSGSVSVMVVTLFGAIGRCPMLSFLGRDSPVFDVMQDVDSAGCNLLVLRRSMRPQAAAEDRGLGKIDSFPIQDHELISRLRSVAAYPLD